MLSFFLSLIPGLSGIFNTLNNITAALADAKIAEINAKTEQERIYAQERVSTIQAQRDLMIADSQVSKLDIWVRSLIALGPTVYLLKIFIWDKVMNSVTNGTTDPLDPNLWTVVTAVLGFYFLSTAVITTAKILKA